MTESRTTGSDRAPRSLPPLSNRIAVVVNGNARSVTSEVISTLDQILQGGDLFVSRRLEEGPELARTIINRGYGTFLCLNRRHLFFNDILRINFPTSCK